MKYEDSSLQSCMEDKETKKKKKRRAESIVSIFGQGGKEQTFPTRREGWNKVEK